MQRINKFINLIILSAQSNQPRHGHEYRRQGGLSSGLGISSLKLSISMSESKAGLLSIAKLSKQGAPLVCCAARDIISLTCVGVPEAGRAKRMARKIGKARHVFGLRE